MERTTGILHRVWGARARENWVQSQLLKELRRTITKLDYYNNLSWFGRYHSARMPVEARLRRWTGHRVGITSIDGFLSRLSA